MALVLPHGQPLTVEDVGDPPDDGHRYELIDGTLIVTPAPGTDHQIVVARLVMLLGGLLDAELTVLTAPYDVVLSESTKVQPDVLVARTADLGPRRLERAPVLAVEVLSPSTRRIDLGTKRLALQGAGVPSYWVVDPEDPVRLTVFRLDGREYRVAADVGGDEAHVDADLGVTVVPGQLLHR